MHAEYGNADQYLIKVMCLEYYSHNGSVVFDICIWSHHTAVPTASVVRETNMTGQDVNLVFVKLSYFPIRQGMGQAACSKTTP